MKSELVVKGMTCNHCVMHVSKAIKELEGVTKVDVDLSSGKVQVEHASEIERIKFKEAVDEAGYELV